MSDPLTTVIEGLATVGQASDPLAWLVLAAFLAASLLEAHDRDLARPVAVGAWVLFGLFWFSLIHHFAFVQKSFIEGVGTVVAVPACLSAAALLWRGRDSLFVLTRSVAVMGALLLPFEAVPFLRRVLIETVTVQTEFLINLLGFDPAVLSGTTVDGRPIGAKEHPYRSTFLFRTEGGAPITLTIKLACTGLGSIAIFAGLIAAVDAPFRRKLRAFAVSVPVIYGLNLVRNVFITVAFGTQAMHLFPDAVMAAFAVDNPVMVSYYVADRVIAQTLSVVVLVGITWLVVRQLPETLRVVEDALYVLTRREYDLGAALDVDRGTVRADGGSRVDED